MPTRSLIASSFVPIALDAPPDVAFRAFSALIASCAPRAAATTPTRVRNDRPGVLFAFHDTGEHQPPVAKPTLLSFKPLVDARRVHRIVRGLSNRVEMHGRSDVGRDTSQPHNLLRFGVQKMP